MAIRPFCDDCCQELNEPGGLLLTPPEDGHVVKKLHLCRTCCERIVAALRAFNLTKRA